MIEPRLRWATALMLSIVSGVVLFLAVPSFAESLMFGLLDMDYFTDSRLPEWGPYAIMVLLHVVGPYIGARLIFKKLRWRRTWDDTPYCTQCRYNLTGNVSGICPECGTAAPTHAA